PAALHGAQREDLEPVRGGIALAVRDPADPDLLLALEVGVDREDVGVRAGPQALAGAARSAGARGSALADEPEREPLGGEELPDPFRTCEEQRVGETALARGAEQTLHRAGVALGSLTAHAAPRRGSSTRSRPRCARRRGGSSAPRAPRAGGSRRRRGAGSRGPSPRCGRPPGIAGAPRPRARGRAR